MACLCRIPYVSVFLDISANIHLESIAKTAEWQHKISRSALKGLKFTSKVDRSEKPTSMLDNQPKKPDQRRKYSRLIKPSTINALTASKCIFQYFFYWFCIQGFVVKLPHRKNAWEIVFCQSILNKMWVCITFKPI